MNHGALKPLRAGALSARWEPGGLRYIRRGDCEVIRRIYGAVRDPHWGTVPSEVSDVRIEEGAEEFRITFTSTHQEGPIDFSWRGTITGTPAGEIRFEFDGEARSAFSRNRIGLCALHPASCAGAATRQKRTDGTTIEGAFPKLIEPQVIGGYTHQNLRGLSHEVAPGVWCEAEFEGETFETEDQRNWIDASFKTYGTPLALPFPAEIAKGTRVWQRITIRLLAEPAARIEAITSEREQGIVVELGPDPLDGGAPVPSLPEIGLGIPLDGPALIDREVERLGAAGFAHLRIDLNLASPRWADALERGLTDAANLTLPLEVAATLPAKRWEDALRELRHRARDEKKSIKRFIIYQNGEPAAPPATMREARRILYSLGKPLGSGANANFCELNLAQRLGKAAMAESDFICWAANPQAHAADELSIAENATAVAATIEAARAFCGEKPLLISPLTLKPRFNATAMTAETAPKPGELPRSVDPRQRSLFAGSWTIAALKPIFEAPIHAATVYETAGWRGLFERSFGSRMPEQFPSKPGEYFPGYFALTDLAGFSWRGRPIRSRSNRPFEVESLAIAWKDALLVFIGNMTNKPQRAHIRGWPNNEEVRFRKVDESNKSALTPEGWSISERTLGVEHLTPENREVEVTLPPYAFGRLLSAIEWRR